MVNFVNNLVRYSKLQMKLLFQVHTILTRTGIYLVVWNSKICKMLCTGRTVNDVVFLTSLASPEFDIFSIYQRIFYLLDSAHMLPRQRASLFWPIYQSFHDFHLTSARMLPRQHAYYFFLAYLAVFLWFWASQHA